MRVSLVAANWKMHGSKAFITELLVSLRQHLEGAARAEFLVCPPAPYLALCQKLLQGSQISLGAQNAHEAEAGAFTGEVSASMLADFGVTKVILGHSERRQLFGETNTQIAAKCAAVLSQGMSPLLCVGETLREREAGLAEEVVTQQLKAVLDSCGVQFLSDCVIAYEPVWAIGTGKTASPAQAQHMHALVRELLAERDVIMADKVRILYGGSVSAENAAELFSQKDIDGGLVGGASLKPEEFITICKSVS